MFLAQADPQLGVRVPKEVQEALREMSAAGLTTREALTRICEAWRQWMLGTAGRGNAAEFGAALRNFAAVGPAVANVDIEQVRRDAREQALADAAAEAMRVADDAALLGSTAVMIVLLEKDESPVRPETVEAITVRWFRQNTDRLRRLLGHSRRARDMLCGAVGRVCGEPAQAADYISRLLRGQNPGQGDFEDAPPGA